MNPKSPLWLWAAFVASLAAVGIPYLRVPYEDISLPNTLVTLALVVVFVTAMLATSLGWARVRRAIIVLGGVVPLAVMARAAWEWTQDPGTPHDLWPFEFIIATFVGVAVAAPGAVLGAFPDLIRILRRTD